MKIIGISGLARSGKDSFFELSKTFLKNRGVKYRRMSFADELKEECEELLSKYTGISAFTEKDSEKEIIRPLLVTYGTHIRRRLNKNCWIEKIEPKVIECFANEEVVFITDVRFENEINWIHDHGGKSVHVTRCGITPPNKDEEENDPILRRESNFKIKWNNFESEDMIKVNKEIEKILNESI